LIVIVGVGKFSSIGAVSGWWARKKIERKCGILEYSTWVLIDLDTGKGVDDLFEAQQ
jgi:hypothetical protein